MRACARACVCLCVRVCVCVRACVFCLAFVSTLADIYVIFDYISYFPPPFLNVRGSGETCDHDSCCVNSGVQLLSHLGIPCCHECNVLCFQTLHRRSPRLSLCTCSADGVAFQDVAHFGQEVRELLLCPPWHLCVFVCCFLFLFF